MLKTLLISMIFVMGTVGITTSGMAADNHYHDNMHELDHHLKNFKSAKDSKKARAALQGMQKSVEVCQKNLPSGLQKLKSKDAKITAYQGLLTDLLKEIKQAEQLVAANQLAKAQTLTEKMDQIKKQGHQAFK
ncbi:cytochrome b562 [Acinetobacter variabilis]|uniref:cytochrome b562 n=1 Tax=Acinetobacter variabilis TaxID=70346 RepID=UPI001330FEDB|nr:cytochrome b562 [Acinetobacter variabilis]